MVFRELSSDDRDFSGTVFLDEVADLSPQAQVALLRWLDGYGFNPVGHSGLPFRPCVRVVAATNQEVLTNKAAFRQDLYHRLHHWPVRLPFIQEGLTMR